MNGTNALALYRLTRVPEKKEKRKRPRNIAISINNISEIGIDYSCPSCGKSTNIKSTTSRWRSKSPKVRKISIN